MNKFKSDYLEDFAYLYNNYKEKGLIPKEIKEKLTFTLKYKESKYYEVLKECRKIGLINDSYEENREKMIERMTYDSNISVKETDNIIKQASVVRIGSFEKDRGIKGEGSLIFTVLKRLFKRNKN